MPSHTFFSPGPQQGKAALLSVEQTVGDGSPVSKLTREPVERLAIMPAQTS